MDDRPSLPESTGNTLKSLPELLIVEDNLGDQRLMQEALGASHLHLRFVSDGVEALNYLRRQGNFGQAARPNLIILDLNLPRMGGWDVLNEIKQDERLRSIPVVVFTTSRAEADISNSYASHANCYVTKPHDLEEYLSTMRTLEKFWLGTAALPGSPRRKLAAQPSDS
jgi:CheY-like chemotaxis protein